MHVRIPNGMAKVEKLELGLELGLRCCLVFSILYLVPSACTHTYAGRGRKLDRLSQLFVASKGQKHFSQIWRQKLEVRVGEGAKCPYV